MKVPGESDGSCNRGIAGSTTDPEWGMVDPPAGAWFPQQALQLAQLASSAAARLIEVAGILGRGGAAARPRTDLQSGVHGGGGQIADIRDVARRSGVSIATVSRVLNGTAKVSDEARERVLAEAAALEYVPSAAARTLVTRRSQILGIVLNTGADHPDIGHPFFQDVLTGLKHAAGELGYDLLVFAAYRPKEFLRRALHHRVDGLILMGVDRREPELARLLERHIPAVAVDLDVTGQRVGYVTSDNVDGARLAVRHLHGLGHRRIATVTGPPRAPAGRGSVAGVSRRARRSRPRRARGRCPRGRLLRRERLPGGSRPARRVSSVRPRYSLPAT